MLQAGPVTSNCAAILERGRHVMLAVSPFNSRYCDAHVARMVEWARHRVLDFDVLLPGEVSTSWLLEACGERKARAKARHEVARKRRAVERAVRAHDPHRVVGIHDFADLAENPQYIQLHAEVRRGYAEDPDFRRACLEMSAQAVTGRLRAVRGAAAEADECRAAAAVRYLLDELPYFLGGADILGREESLIAYHRPWKLWNHIDRGDFPVKIRPNQGFLVLNEP
ncbi:tRNA-dependent cyclodipeptide synthase [Nocardia blacklockiae]|uniref:tRNA-dependent cyclodipeptide synthase n=1 Tax=Nocardia blacklockiae TaxID=480036 RepID=UPI001893C4DB|nr:tRNA-dependent cyclodipeptide synthase [Nocardia blacklockiae]MBF6169959.1 tRNA-dependent cyclodipeptide synthase [Nocardia blacklockiae]